MTISLEPTARIVAAYVGSNSLDPKLLPQFIRAVHAALTEITRPTPVPTRQEPAVPPKKSVFPDYIICLEDGKKFKMLKRHLMATYNMTPEQYREKWELPSSYPLVAPNYAQRRSSLARDIGLGRMIKTTPERPGPATEAPVQPVPKKKRGRRSEQA